MISSTSFPHEISYLREIVTRPETEDRLIKKVLAYAKRSSYTKYTSTLAEAWRISIQGLSDSLCQTIDHYGDHVPELDADEDYQRDPAAAFGILEAQRHRSRGVTLALFLGLMKYYRQSYLDVVAEAGCPPAQRDYYLLYVTRFFDRVEIGFCSEWAGTAAEHQLDELRVTNVRMTNEKNKYLTIFESLSAPVLLVNPDLTIENANHAAMYAFYGLDRPGLAYYDESDRALTLEWLEGDIETFAGSNQREVHVKKQVETKLGLRHYDVHFQKMLDVSDKYAGITVVFNDVTPFVEFEEIQKQFVSTVSHELRTPITAIDLSIRNLLRYQDRLAAAQRQEIIEVLSQSSAVLTTMIEDLLVLSRVDSHRIVLERETFDFGGLVAQVVGELRPKQEARDIRVHTRAPPDVTYHGDLTRLGQVIRILLDNAIKYSSPGSEVEVTITRGTNRLQLAVADHGRGIHADDLPNLFQRFFRSEDVWDVQGTGLGLAIAQELVELHGGTIDVSSTLGEGSTFVVSLPVAPTSDEAHE